MNQSFEQALLERMLTALSTNGEEKNNVISECIGMLRVKTGDFTTGFVEEVDFETTTLSEDDEVSDK